MSNRRARQPHYERLSAKNNPDNMLISHVVRAILKRLFNLTMAMSASKPIGESNNDQR